MALRAILGTQPYHEMRYPTVGDWMLTETGILAMSAEMKNPDHEFLVAVHELVEAYLCRKHEVSEQAVTQFDIDFERMRGEDDFSEPGDDPAAPYRAEHQAATEIERLLAEKLGVNWAAYEEAVNAL